MEAFAKNASQSINNTNDLIAFVKQAPAAQIHNFIDDNFSALPFPMYWAPTVESESK